MPALRQIRVPYTPRLWGRGLAVLLLCAATAARAHIGSPDTFVQANAGPYTVLLSVHPPTAYPGAAQVELRAADITSATVALGASAPQPLQSSGPGVYTASLWTPTSAAHFLHLRLTGEQGTGALDLTLPANPAAASPTPNRNRELFFLFALLLALLAIAIAITSRKPLGRIAALAIAIAAAALCVFALRTPRSSVPATQLAATLNSTGMLHLTLTNPHESFLDLVPDDGKLLHLFLIRQPRLDLLIHLHPTQEKVPNQFDVQLPVMPSGAYSLYADLYHATGVEDTATLNLDLPGQSTSPTPLAGDDSVGSAAPISAAAPRPEPIPLPSGQLSRTAHLLDGYTMQLTTAAGIQQIHPHTAQLLTVTLLDPAGQPAKDMALYLGMPAHAVVYRADGGVFAHIHPGGTLPMTSMPVMNLDAMSTMSTAEPVPATATIPYGFPSPGLYRLFIQMRHSKVVETAAFDLNVQ